MGVAVPWQLALPDSVSDSVSDNASDRASLLHSFATDSGCNGMRFQELRIVSVPYQC